MGYDFDSEEELNDTVGILMRFQSILIHKKVYDDVMEAIACHDILHGDASEGGSGANPTVEGEDVRVIGEKKEEKRGFDHSSQSS